MEIKPQIFFFFK